MAYFLFKLTFCWGAFALIYLVFLRRETFFTANRAYLLTTFWASLIFSLIPESSLEVVLPQSGLPVLSFPEVLIGGGNATGLNPPENATTIAWWQWTYLLGVCFFAGRMIAGLGRILQLMRSAQKTRLADGSIQVQSDAVKTPCSFFRWVFLPANPDPEQLAMLLLHERAHVRAWHSVDVLLAELGCIAFWFHPLAHWYRKALRTVHEYQADAAASRQFNIKQYGLLLIGQAQSGMLPVFVNHFYQSPLKQRLNMLMKKSSSPVRALKFGFTIPVILLFLLIFRQTSLSAQENSIDAPAQFPGGTEKLMQYLAQNIHYPEAARKARDEGTVFVSFTVKKDGALSNIEALKSSKPINETLVTEGLRVVKSMSKWKPAVQNGKIVKSKMTLPIKFKLDDDAVEMFDLSEAPAFPGGEAEMMGFLAKNIVYPAESRQNQVEGMVAVQFIVETDGSLSNFTNLHSPNGPMYEEVVRVLKLMPKFSPGKKDGQPVRVKYTLPVRFKL